ncbi:helix-turn-helix domain-containing protein [Nonomuraea guangzhouensis]|uniref:Helix-turn-helix domain-containing protein n=1 Tax=Nonomuraea guangzhouensis TaxID=1291555 RepID=A0ABW4GBA5_9ACTN|nr:helix-turn-helix transcriptional regulator [Nonomuraea guangzhouensis]
MATSPSSSVQDARKAIAARLREILRDAGLTNRAFARQSGWEESKVSRLVTGRTPPSDTDIRTWCQICASPEEIPNLIAASRNAENTYIEWRRVQRSQKRMQELGKALFENSSLYRFYSSNLVPWPLQVPAYMRAIMTRFSEFHEVPVPDIEEAVKTRLARRRLLDSPSRRCVLIIEESVLRDRPFSDVIMREQLSHLLIGMHQPNISLGIIPSGVSRVQKVTESFLIYDDSTVVIELVSAIVNLTQPREIGLYVKCFGDLKKDAVFGNPARALIDSALEALLD